MEVFLYRDVYPVWHGYFRGPWLSFATTDEFSVRMTKITSRIGSPELTAYFFVLDLFLTQCIMAILSTGSKQENFESNNSLKLSFKNIPGLC